MPEPLWTLLAVAVGGAIPVIGKIVSDWQLARLDRANQAADFRRQQLYQLQDEMTELIIRVVKIQNGPREEDTDEARHQLQIDAVRVMRIGNSLVVRIGHTPLVQAFGALFTSTRLMAQAKPSDEVAYQQIVNMHTKTEIAFEVMVADLLSGKVTPSWRSTDYHFMVELPWIDDMNHPSPKDADGADPHSNR